MGRRERQAGRITTKEPEQQQEGEALRRALHRSVFAYLTRPVPDPDHPGQHITYGELDQRLRGRAYRQMILTGGQMSPR